MGLTAQIRPVAAVLFPDIAMILLSSFVFGLVFGSFLNVVIYRLKNGRNIIFGRSFCPECKNLLKWYDLIPILSFIWLRRYCRYCHKKISWQYPIVEILSGLIWVLIFYKVFNFSAQGGPALGWQFLNFVYYIFIFSSLLVVAVYDFKWKIIPDKIIYPAIAVALVYNIFNIITPPNLPLSGEELGSLPDKGGMGWVFIWPFLVAIIAFLFFFLIFYFSKGRAMGLGDAKLAFLIGLFLSPLLAIAAFMLAFIIGAVWGIILIGLGKIFSHYKKWGMKSQIAFGPFLILGTIIVFFFSNFIIKLLNLN